MSPRWITLLSLIIPALAFALPCGPNASSIEDLRAVTLKPLGVVHVDEAERKMANAYGLAHQMTKEAVEARYAATGDIRCPKGQAQAQVTVKNDVLVSAAHVFVHGGKCDLAVQPSKCTFTIRVGGKNQIYAIDHTIESGWSCPHTGDRPDGLDWIVLKLKKPVDPRVKPYQIPTSPRLALKANQDIVAVAKAEDWPPGNHKSPIMDRPRFYGDCRTRFVASNRSTTGRVETDCDWTHGASGGSLLTPGADPVLVAVIRAETDVKKLGDKCDPSLGKGGHDTYHEHCWTNYATPVSGRLWTAIAAATGVTAAPEPTPEATPEPESAPTPDPEPPSPFQSDPEHTGPNRRHDLPGGGYYRNF